MHECARTRTCRCVRVHADISSFQRQLSENRKIVAIKYKTQARLLCETYIAENPINIACQVALIIAVYNRFFRYGIYHFPKPFSATATKYRKNRDKLSAWSIITMAFPHKSLLREENFITDVGRRFAGNILPSWPRE